MEKAIDRYFKFIDEYYKESSVPLSYVLLPNPATTGFRAMNSPIGMTKLNKREWSKVAKLNFGRAYCSASTANKSNGTGGRGGVISPYNRDGVLNLPHEHSSYGARLRQVNSAESLQDAEQASKRP